MRFSSFVLGLSVAAALAACQQRPVQDLALADVALKAAQKVKADALAPDLFRKAENHYLRAKKDYADGYFDSSKRMATQARVLAEQAEYKALLKQTQIQTKGDDPSAAPAPAPPPPAPTDLQP